MKAKRELPNKVILIGGLPRSGKTLIRNALDAHSQIAIPPSAFSFFHYFDDEQFAARGGFEENLHYFFTQCRKSQSWNIKRQDAIIEGSDQRDLYLALLETYRRTHAPTKQYVGEYTHLVEERWPRLVEWFGLERIRFIQVLRNPFDNYASWVMARKIDPALRAQTTPNAPVHRFCDMWARSAVTGLSLAVRHPESFRTMFLEDVHAAPMEAMESLCRWLGVPVEADAMLEMEGAPKKRNSAFPVPQRPPKGIGHVGSDGYDRRKHLTTYEHEVLSAACGADLPRALGFEDGPLVLDWKRSRPVAAQDYSTRLAAMMRTYLSPLSNREIMRVTWRHNLHVTQSLSATLFQSLKRRLRRRSENGNAPPHDE